MNPVSTNKQTKIQEKQKAGEWCSKGKSQGDTEHRAWPSTRWVTQSSLHPSQTSPVRLTTSICTFQLSAIHKQYVSTIWPQWICASLHFNLTWSQQAYILPGQNRRHFSTLEILRLRTPNKPGKNVVFILNQALFRCRQNMDSATQSWLWKTGILTGDVAYLINCLSSMHEVFNP